VGTDTTLELLLDRTTRIVAPGRFTHLADGFAGVRFRKEGDQSFLLPYRAWLEEALRNQRKRDQQSYDPKGVQGRAQEEEKRPGSQIRLLSDRDPLVLVICEGEAVAERMNQALGRRFGIAFLDYVQGEVRPLLGGEGDWGRYKLILAHQRLRVTSGLELTRQLVQDEKCPLPILVAGTEEDVSLKRNRAIAAGAVDFISVDPFNVLKVMKAIADTLAMFG
jgi:CheY-like chemotaxis protein